MSHDPRRWDTVMRWNETAAAWWWNDWCEVATELTGLAPTREAARAAVAEQIRRTERDGSTRTVATATCFGGSRGFA